MKNNIFYITIFIVGLISFSSCQNDDPDQGSSIFNETVELNSFDKWLDDNYRKPYNIRVAYRIEDVETDFTYNVIPADIEKSKQMAFLLKYLWLEPYTEVAADGVHFIRATAPKLFHFIGSAEHDPGAGTIRLGVAEGGKKITITQVNTLQPYNIINQSYFNTVHHEFAHILHQTKNIPREFIPISSADYGPTTWQNRDDKEAAELGFVSRYAGSQYHEDFVEVLSRYITRDADAWDATLALAGAEGEAKILKKLEIVKTYMRVEWGVDVEQLKKTIQRRALEIQFIDFDNLDF